jgi:hypothetical protein
VKHFLPILVAVFLLSSCIPIEDFGVYWDRGIVDSSLLGRWEHTGKDQDKYQVTDHQGTYYLDAFENGNKRPQDDLSARTLHIGNYVFLMVKVRISSTAIGLARYEVEDRKLKLYVLSKDKMRIFLKKYPGVKNIKVSSGTTNSIFDTGVTVKKLDEAVHKIISDIPDTKEFWSLSDQWRKVP